MSQIKYGFAIYARTSRELPYEYCGVGQFDINPKAGEVISLGETQYEVEYVDFEEGLYLTEFHEEK